MPHGVVHDRQTQATRPEAEKESMRRFGWRATRPNPSRRDGNMEESSPQTRNVAIGAGSLVILHPDGPAGGFPMVIAVDHVAEGQYVFVGCCDPIGPGEALIIESPVANDARYVSRGIVVASSPDAFTLEIDPLWERVQQRAFVRISAHGLPVRIVRLAHHPAPSDSDVIHESGTDAVHDLVDISAGGIRFESASDYEPDEDVICHFELPGSLCFVLPARTIRSPEETVTVSGKPSVAVEFVGLDENNRSQLLRWVYREQVRRHRDAERDEAEDRERTILLKQSRRSADPTTQA
jgi:hypothetical protein